MINFNDEKAVKSKLEELNKRNIPKMTLQKLIEADRFNYLKPYMDNATKEEILKCEEHLNKYCEVGYNDGKDIFSDEECTFFWGLHHGEMITNDNGLARTYYHYLTLGGKRHKVVALLQYHPSCYELKV